MFTRSDYGNVQNQNQHKNSFRGTECVCFSVREVAEQLICTTYCLFFSEGGGGTADLAVFGGGSSTLPENFPGEADEQGQKGE